jgi:hypothetical protein
MICLTGQYKLLQNSNIKSVLLGSETEKSSSVKIIDYIDTILGNELKGIKPNTEHPIWKHNS